MTEIIKHDTLVEALCAAALEMGYVDKGQKNAHEGYNFRGIDDVMFGVRNPLMRHGVFIHYTYGQAVSVLPVDHPDHDPYFFRLPITASIRHAHSDATLAAHFEGLGRQAGKGNVTNPDPRALGQASSYGIKMWLLGEFMVAGGDDSADEAPEGDERPVTAPKAKAEPKPADPETEQARKELLEAIGKLDNDAKAALKDWCKAESIVVSKATLDDLNTVADQMARMADEANAANIAAMPGDKDEEPDGEPEGEELPPAAEQARAAQHPSVTEEPERHLAAVPDEQPEEKPKARQTRKPDVAEVPEGTGEELELSDQQFAYLLASGGEATGPNDPGIKGQMQMLSAALKYMGGLRNKRLERDGALLKTKEGEVVVDGTEAIARYRAS